MIHTTLIIDHFANVTTHFHKKSRIDMFSDRQEFVLFDVSFRIAKIIDITIKDQHGKSL